MSQAAASRTLRAEAALAAFHHTPLDQALGRSHGPELAAHVLEFFRGVAREVPAYARFLETHGTDPREVTSLESFARLPATTKADYQRAFPLSELCRGGTLDGADFFALSSGSTGEPTPWPRFVSDEVGTAFRFEQVLRDAFRAHEIPTLGVVCFALGSWVGGLYTTFACRHVAAKGYPLTLVTPGSNKAEILRAVRALAPHFRQTVLFGYPPFLKDVIDAGVAEGLDWGSYSPRLVTAGEVFSEEWRSLICDRLGGQDPCRHTASLYGTADGGVLANETPLSIRIRRLLAQHPGAARELFGEARLPTLCQYDPYHRYFECEGAAATGTTATGDLLFSGDGGVPLVRYKILDRGGVVPYREMMDFLASTGNVLTGTADAGRPERALPFVYVFGRSNFALSFYGANLYPENVSIGLERPALAPHVSGKFVMQIVETAARDPELRIFVELAPNATANSALERDLALSIRTELERVNSEFLAYAPDARRTPRVTLLPLGHPEYFPPGTKHRYTRS
ncbi:MAG TPA: phenylacetate--CoA ligase family protein [Polyangiaceae bacterium]